MPFAGVATTPVPDCCTSQKAAVGVHPHSQTHGMYEDRQVADSSVPFPQTTENRLNGREVICIRLYARCSVQTEINKSP